VKAYLEIVFRGALEQRGGAPAAGTGQNDHCMPSVLLSISLCPESRVTLKKH